MMPTVITIGRLMVGSQEGSLFFGAVVYFLAGSNGWQSYPVRLPFLLG